jgi:YgiT-type zinc finger domain-containing protein
MKNDKSTYDFGNCDVCGGPMREEKINQDFWVKGKLIVINSVPAGVCTQCGEKVVKADVGRQLAALIYDYKRLPKRRTMNVPVVRYTAFQQRGQGMKFIPVNSRMILGVRYDEKSHNMEVVFRTGERYRYRDVPESQYEALLKAESKGQYMHKNILGSFAYERI